MLVEQLNKLHSQFSLGDQVKRCRGLFALFPAGVRHNTDDSRPSATPAAPKPRLRRLVNSNSNAVCHRRHNGDLRSKITPPTL